MKSHRAPAFLATVALVAVGTTMSVTLSAADAAARARVIGMASQGVSVTLSPGISGGTKPVKQTVTVASSFVRQVPR
jgi:hypothetical protein